MGREADQVFGRLLDMYTTNTLFRREFGLAPGLVRDVAEEDGRRTRLVCEHLDLIMTVLARHQHSQDGRLRQVIGHVRALMDAWRESASSLDAKPLAGALDQLVALLNDQMAREEERLLWPRAASVAV